MEEPCKFMGPDKFSPALYELEGKEKKEKEARKRKNRRQREKKTEIKRRKLEEGTNREQKEREAKKNKNLGKTKTWPKMSITKGWHKEIEELKCELREVKKDRDECLARVKVLEERLELQAHDVDQK